MRLRPGDRLRCSNHDCRLQVLVTDSGSGKQTETLLRCSCGGLMKRFYEKPAVTKVKLTSAAGAEDAEHGSTP